MKDLKEWNAFAMSGKVEDYLRYVAKAATEGTTEGQEPDIYAGFTGGDRPHTESGAYRGI